MIHKNLSYIPWYKFDKPDFLRQRKALHARCYYHLYIYLDIYIYIYLDVTRGFSPF